LGAPKDSQWPVTVAEGVHGAALHLILAAAAAAAAAAVRCVGWKAVALLGRHHMCTWAAWGPQSAPVRCVQCH